MAAAAEAARQAKAQVDALVAAARRRAGRRGVPAGRRAQAAPGAAGRAEAGRRRDRGREPPLGWVGQAHRPADLADRRVHLRPGRAAHPPGLRLPLLPHRHRHRRASGQPIKAAAAGTVVSASIQRRLRQHDDHQPQRRPGDDVRPPEPVRGAVRPDRPAGPGDRVRRLDWVQQRPAPALRGARQRRARTTRWAGSAGPRAPSAADGPSSGRSTATGEVAPANVDSPACPVPPPVRGPCSPPACSGRSRWRTRAACSPASPAPASRHPRRASSTRRPTGSADSAARGRPRQLERAAVEGMLKALGDRWSTYFPAADFA